MGQRACVISYLMGFFPSKQQIVIHAISKGEGRPLSEKSQRKIFKWTKILKWQSSANVENQNFMTGVQKEDQNEGR